MVKPTEHKIYHLIIFKHGVQWNFKYGDLNCCLIISTALPETICQMMDIMLHITWKPDTSLNIAAPQAHQFRSASRMPSMFNTFKFTVIHAIYTLEGFHPISKVFQTFWKNKFPGKTISTVKQKSQIIGINQVKAESLSSNWKAKLENILLYSIISQGQSYRHFIPQI